MKMDSSLLHTPEGVRDLYGDEQERKMAVEALLLQKIHAYGYRDIEPPTFEFFDVFSREVGTTPSKELYKFIDKEGNTLVLRPDFTPSIARCAAKYFKEDNVPLRFCYMGSTFTNASSLQGKLKETTQVGAELVGDGSIKADGEMIAMMVEALYHAGLADFQVSVGNAEYFKGICEEAGLSAETELALREFISGKNYFGAENLLEQAQVPEKARAALLKTDEYTGSVEALQEAKALADNPRSLQAIERLEQVYTVLQAYGVEQYVSFDLTMLSKYNYYTGIIFKGYTYGVGEPIVKGGRYDTLLSHFGKDAPAIGFSIGMDGLMTALNRQSAMIVQPQKRVQLYYTEEDFPQKLKEAKIFRSEGKNVELLPESAQDGIKQ